MLECQCPSKDGLRLSLLFPEPLVFAAAEDCVHHRDGDEQPMDADPPTPEEVRPSSLLITTVGSGFRLSGTIQGP